MNAKSMHDPSTYTLVRFLRLQQMMQKKTSVRVTTLSLSKLTFCILVLQKKLIIFKWIKAEHLDIKDTKGLPDLLQTTGHGWTVIVLSYPIFIFYIELSKMNDYRAPQDKLNGILNVSKMIYGEFEESQRTSDAQASLRLYENVLP
jgi:hypothetical protein